MQREVIGPNGEATLYLGDCRESLKQMESETVQTVVTSPPYYGLRDYGNDGQIGLEESPEKYVTALVEVFREVRRVLRDDGTLWLNLGDSYVANATGGLSTKSSKMTGGRSTQKEATKRPDKKVEGLKQKDLIGIPWRVAFALQADGWYLRQDIIWHKPNPMPESVTDRCTKAHEYLFLLTKSARYYYDAEAVREMVSEKTVWTYPHTNGKANQGYAGVNTPSSTIRVEPEDGKRNRRSVWTIATQPYSGAHFATFPPKLIEPCILAGSRPGDTVLDPFGGSGTTAGVALEHGRKAILCELNPEYGGLVFERVRSITDALDQARLFKEDSLEPERQELMV